MDTFSSRKRSTSQPTVTTVPTYCGDLSVWDMSVKVGHTIRLFPFRIQPPSPNDSASIGHIAYAASLLHVILPCISRVCLLACACVCPSGFILHVQCMIRGCWPRDREREGFETGMRCGLGQHISGSILVGVNAVVDTGVSSSISLQAGRPSTAELCRRLQGPVQRGASQMA
jgi:hypothetical protein